MNNWFLLGIILVIAGIVLYYINRNSENRYTKAAILIFIWGILGFLILSSPEFILGR